MLALLALLGVFAVTAKRIAPTSAYWTEERAGVLYIAAARVQAVLAGMAAKLGTLLVRDAESAIVQLSEVGTVADGITTRPALEWVQAATSAGFTVLVHLRAPLLAAVRPSVANTWAATYQESGFWVQGGDVQSGVQWAILLEPEAGTAATSGDPMLPNAPPVAVGADEAQLAAAEAAWWGKFARRAKQRRRMTSPGFDADAISTVSARFPEVKERRI